MILLIDIGNSRIKWVTLQGQMIGAGAVYDYSDIGWSQSAFLTVGDVPSAIYMLSVGSEKIEREVIELCSQRWGISPILLYTSVVCGEVKNGYADPGRLGVDRWAAIIGAYHLVQGACLVIDCGTACSADFVNGDGNHLGGAITAGRRMMLQSLQTKTTGIGEVSEEESNLVPGRSTAQCIEFGVVETLLGFIERMEHVAREQLGEDIVVVLTGGDAPGLLPHLPRNIRYEKELVFYGMVGMVKENKG